MFMGSKYPTKFSISFENKMTGVVQPLLSMSLFQPLHLLHRLGAASTLYCYYKNLIFIGLSIRQMFNSISITASLHPVTAVWQ